MKLTLEPVTAENRKTAEGLTVFPEQSGFIETVAECMQEADELSVWRPVLIRMDGTPVGFSMYGWFAFEEPGKLWFDRLLIDHRYQHHGIGRQVIPLILGRMRREYPDRPIYLSVYPDNPVAIALYKSFGFTFNGEKDYNGEDVMVLPANTPLE